MEEDFGHEIYLDEVLDAITSSLNLKKPYSLVRFGHAEMAVLSYKFYRNPGFEYYYKYDGITELSENITLRLSNSFRNANLVGMTNHTPKDNKLLKDIMNYYKLSFPVVCNAWINEEMRKSEDFFDILRTRKVVIVGRRAKEAAEKFRGLGVNVVSNIGHEGFDQIPMTMKAISDMPDFDIALISAGVPATIMCPEVAKMTGKVAIDFGSAIDVLVDGDKFDDEKLVAEFNRKMRERG
ncbi:GT-D fold domain-containing protein [Clostridium hydrogenum]|uniref:GT-D fold domain-containing protein n=1 Tax=Clostridium hydrogenum TaxID=2855764 RepID=UPI002E36C8C4|nr:GT-D fold domain-containing glycosyltransferase [Clostridium hydrogenum]